MQHEIKKLIQDIVKDYANWQGLCAANRTDTCSTRDKVQKDMFDRFKSRIDFKVGNKYVKIFTQGGSVWGFVVNTDNDKKFRKGDILKAAGYNAPARNAARGNILDGGYKIEWFPGSQLLPLMRAPSGHLVIPCDLFDNVKRGTAPHQRAFYTDHATRVSTASSSTGPANPATRRGNAF